MMTRLIEQGRNKRARDCRLYWPKMTMHGLPDSVEERMFLFLAHLSCACLYTKYGSGLIPSEINKKKQIQNIRGQDARLFQEAEWR
jgi:hypothetical protein